MRRLLITGGAGFIGSHFVLRHVERFTDDRIVVLDKLTYAADLHFLEPVKDRIGFIKGDIVDQTLVAKIIKDEKIDTIINFAAESHVDNSIEDASPFLHTNVMGVQALIEVLRQFPKILLLHISTDEVYGDIDDHDRPRTVEDPLIPSSPYAASKAAGDLLLIAAMRTYGLRARISRCTNNFGPHQADEKFIPTVIRCALEGASIPIYAQGKNKRDWLYVTDHCAAIEVVLEKGLDGHLYNVSADTERQNVDVAKDILMKLEKPEQLLNFVADRPGHDWRYALDSSIVRGLGWKPLVSFEAGMVQTIEWYQRRFGPH